MRILIAILVLLGLVGADRTPVASSKDVPLTSSLVMAQADPPDGVCGGGTSILFVNYPANSPGVPTWFDLVFTGSEGSIGGSVSFGTGDGPETGVVLPANSSPTVYTLTLAFPYGLNLADMHVTTAGDACTGVITKPIHISDLSIRMRQ